MTAAISRFGTAPIRAVRRLDRGARTLGPRARRTLTVVVALVVVIAVAAVTVLAVLLIRAHSRDTAAAEATASARDSVATLLSYDASALDADLGRSRSLIAPEFGPEFDRLVEQLIAPSARQTKLVTRAEVLRTAAISAEPDRVEVLAFLRQTTTRPGSEPAITGSRATVTLTRDGGRWLVAGLSPV